MQVCRRHNLDAAAWLQRRFAVEYRVTATDQSAKQLQHAAGLANIEYLEGSAESIGLSDSSIDLVTVAQALHWCGPVHSVSWCQQGCFMSPSGSLGKIPARTCMTCRSSFLLACMLGCKGADIVLCRFDLPAFYAEARRVLRPSGTLAVWGYDRPYVKDEPVIDELLTNLYGTTLGPYWDDRRRLIEQHYTGETCTSSCMPAMLIIASVELPSVAKTSAMTP